MVFLLLQFAYTSRCFNGRIFFYFNTPEQRVQGILQSMRFSWSIVFRIFEFSFCFQETFIKYECCPGNCKLQHSYFRKDFQMVKQLMNVKINIDIVHLLI